MEEVAEMTESPGEYTASSAESPRLAASRAIAEAGHISIIAAFRILTAIEAGRVPGVQFGPRDGWLR